jgi:hypothetical protein
MQGNYINEKSVNMFKQAQIECELKHKKRMKPVGIEIPRNQARILRIFLTSCTFLVIA